MNSRVYSKLAVTNIKNNGKTYIPYIAASAFMVMMYYMMDALAGDGNIQQRTLMTILGMARDIIKIFAVIFLFYTNSFLIKRRKKEIGVYNILGMGKNHLFRMMAIETFSIAFVSIVCGLGAGIVFGKLMYLILQKILHYDVGLYFSVSASSIMASTMLFGLIFLATLMYNLWQIRKSNPVEFLTGGNAGEREPKTKLITALAGLILLGIGYYIAQTTEDPLSALQLFFVAVLCVILGTYALFTAGSIAFLKLLKQNKKFYYKTKHFTSVSGMIYRMKQNAVGLANICILSTMAIVTISTTICLYTGMEDMLRYRFKRDCSIDLYDSSVEENRRLDQLVADTLEAAGAEAEREVAYVGNSVAMLQDGNSFADDTRGDYTVDDVVILRFLTMESYEAITGETADLDENEALCYAADEPLSYDSIKVYGKTVRIKEEITGVKLEEKLVSTAANIQKEYYLVVPDEEALRAITGSATYTVKFDVKGTSRAARAFAGDIVEKTKDMNVYIENRELSKESFFELYGGIFFVGMYLGILFLTVTVLIIYYKQISEGYDDRERYQIMQKVGMSKREVKRSIRSQVLTVFFLPLIAAVIHIAVSFKVITKLLLMMNMDNTKLFIHCNIATVLGFAAFYVLVFILTARAYYKIVN